MEIIAYTVAIVLTILICKCCKNFIKKCSDILLKILTLKKDVDKIDEKSKKLSVFIIKALIFAFVLYFCLALLYNPETSKQDNSQTNNSISKASNIITEDELSQITQSEIIAYSVEDIYEILEGDNKLKIEALNKRRIKISGKVDKVERNNDGKIVVSLKYLDKYSTKKVNCYFDNDNLKDTIMSFEDEQKVEISGISIVDNYKIEVYYCYKVEVIPEINDSSSDSGNNIETETIEMSEEQKNRTNFINDCQKEMNYSNPEESFGKVYDIFKDQLNCEYFSFKGKEKLSGLDMIDVFVGLKFNDNWLFDSWDGINVLVAFENEKVYYLIFDDITLWENDCIYKDYNFLKSYWNAFNIEDETETEIKVVAKTNIIEPSLLVPKSAKYSNEIVVKTGEIYTYQGTVESQNAFGVMIPNKFTIQMTSNYTPTYIHIGDDVTGEYMDTKILKQQIIDNL